ncbi:MAG TPA: hypothetical protein VHP33_41470 [Polyangiaceae bacterium]|nr:hypothetical protein [Polyangiaceae bacterium]
MLLLALVFSTQPALAQAGRDDTIQLTVAAPASEAEALGAVVRELLERLAMHVELRRVERLDMRELRQPLRDQPYFARVWVAAGKSGKARLYLEHAARDRVLVRDVEGDAQNPELVREELGHILQAAVEGLKAGEEIGAPRDEALKQVDAEAGASAPKATPPADPAALPQAPSQPKPRRFRFGPRYEVAWLGDGDRFEDGPGAVLGALIPGSERWGLELGGSFRRPLKVEGSPVGARWQSLGVNALVTFDAVQAERSRLRLGVGVGADFVRVSPFAEAGRDVRLASSRWLKLALGRIAVTYAHDVGSFMALEATLGAVLDPNGTRYVLQRSTDATDVLAPWPVRPLLSLGATVP